MFPLLRLGMATERIQQEEGKRHVTTVYTARLDVHDEMIRYQIEPEPDERERERRMRQIVCAGAEYSLPVPPHPFVCPEGGSASVPIRSLGC